MLLIERRRDGGATIIRSCVITQLSREDASLLRYAKPAQVEAPPKESKRRRNDDGLSHLRRALRQSPRCLHAMAEELGLPASAADELLQELFEGVGEAPPQPALRRARRVSRIVSELSAAGVNALQGNESHLEKASTAPGSLSLLAAGANALRRNGSHSEKASTAPGSSEAGLPPVEQRSAPDRSEATRNADLRRRVAAIRLRDMGQHRCPWVRDGYQWFIRQQLAAQPGTRCSCSSSTASNWSTSASRRSMIPSRE